MLIANGRPRGQSHGRYLDSQTIKAPAPGAQRSFDAGKKIVGRKRHIAVDTDGRLLMVNLTSADISDRRRTDGAGNHPQKLALAQAPLR